MEFRGVSIFGAVVGGFVLRKILRLLDRKSSLRRAAKAVVNADFLLVLTGAGMGVDSGLKTYADIADVPAYKEAGLDYMDLCRPGRAFRDPNTFYGLNTMLCGGSKCTVLMIMPVRICAIRVTEILRKFAMRICGVSASRQWDLTLFVLNLFRILGSLLQCLHDSNTTRGLHAGSEMGEDTVCRFRKRNHWRA